MKPVETFGEMTGNMLQDKIWYKLWEKGCISLFVVTLFNHINSCDCKPTTFEVS